MQGSPNQVTSSPWFQWSHPISVKKRSQSFQVHNFFTNNHTFSTIFTCSWNLTHTGFDVQYFIPNSLIASFLRSLCSMFVLWKVGEHAVVGKETLIWIDFRKSPRFSLTSPLSQEREKSSRPVFKMCDVRLLSADQWNCHLLCRYKHGTCTYNSSKVKSKTTHYSMRCLSLSLFTCAILYCSNYHVNVRHKAITQKTW